MSYPFTGLLCVACFTLITPPAVGEIYRWVDRQGITHYADRPSPGENSVEIKRRQLPRLNIGDPAPHAALPSLQPRRARSRPARKPRPAGDCDRYRAAISKIEHALRQGYVEPAGSRMRERKRHWSALLYRHCY
jgi:hypothetical protein